MQKNDDIARMFLRMADILEIQSESPFKVNAYRKAARSILELTEDVEFLWRENRLSTIPGIGKALAKKIAEYLDTGVMNKFEELKSALPESLLVLLRLQGIGPRTLALLHEKLNIQGLKDLKRAMKQELLTDLPGMGERKIENLRRSIAWFESTAGRTPLSIALPIVEEIIHRLRKHPNVGRIHPAGSIRCMRETVGDIDILVETDYGHEVIQSFVSTKDARRVLAAGKTRGSVLLKDDIQVDLRAVHRDSYGAALQYFTGSPAHNVRLRGLAKQAGLKLTEYGIFRGTERIGGGTEEEIYKALNLSWIHPELREDRGEIEASRERTLPELIDTYDINGDLHIHTDWSDGRTSIEAMARKAMKLGYAYIAVCDHSVSAAYAGGLTPERLIRQMEEIQALNEKLTGIRILKGAEVDIRPDGTLDFPDDLLRRLDIVIASVHSGFKTSVTERMIKAVRNPNIHILAHPTGRLLGRREGYQVDLDIVFQTCAETGTALEINACDERLDLNDINVRKAKTVGVRFAINTDAHHPDGMDAMRFGIGMARRAWLTANDILNTHHLDNLSKSQLNKS